MSLSRRHMLLGTTLLLAAGRQACAQAEDHSHHHPVQPAAAASDEHAAHRQMLEHPSYIASSRRYAVPAVMLQDEQGHQVDLSAVLAPSRSVIVNFIYTSCTTVCPVMTATTLQLQRELSGKTAQPAFVSISVDPDFDSPARLKAYAARSGANWTFLTGQRPVVMDALRAFDAWRGSKANHAAITLMRLAGTSPWTRVEGLASARQLSDVWMSLRA